MHVLPPNPCLLLALLLLFARILHAVIGMCYVRHLHLPAGDRATSASDQHPTVKKGGVWGELERCHGTLLL